MIDFNKELPRENKNEGTLELIIEGNLQLQKECEIKIEEFRASNDVNALRDEFHIQTVLRDEELEMRAKVKK